ncbi:hypothetical protein GJ496_007616 [Pomphorhynchus laevis]|nr:hypothetical protein GJ496_007616 [Pomphorhynchus laevis]
MAITRAQRKQQNNAQQLQRQRLEIKAAALLNIERIDLQVAHQQRLLHNRFNQLSRMLIDIRDELLFPELANINKNPSQIVNESFLKLGTLNKIRMNNTVTNKTMNQNRSQLLKKVTDPITSTPISRTGRLWNKALQSATRLDWRRNKFQSNNLTVLKEEQSLTKRETVDADEGHLNGQFIKKKKPRLLKCGETVCITSVTGSPLKYRGKAAILYHQKQPTSRAPQFEDDNLYNLVTSSTQLRRLKGKIGRRTQLLFYTCKNKFLRPPILDSDSKNATENCSTYTSSRCCCC